MKILIPITFFLLLIPVHSSFSEDSISFAVIGDAGHPTSKTEQIRLSIQDSNIQNLILPGDNIYDLSLTYDDVWSSWQQFKFPIVALGNHHQTYLEEIEYFSMPGEFYLKKFEGINFIVLNSDNTQNINAQVSFFADKIKSVPRTEPLFIVFHHPPATISYRHSWQEREAFHNAIRPILLRYRHKIDAILVGHDHQASIFSYGDIPVIVSGAIFEYFPSRDVDQYIDGAKAKTIWRFQSGHYWVRLDVDKKNKWNWINFINVDTDTVDCSIRISRSHPMVVQPNCGK